MSSSPAEDQDRFTFPVVDPTTAVNVDVDGAVVSSAQRIEPINASPRGARRLKKQLVFMRLTMHQEDGFFNGKMILTTDKNPVSRIEALFGS